MEDIEIEYLDEYKDLVLPGIKTSSDRSAATGAISYQVPLPRRRRISSDSSGSSSIDPDIFQKLFDGKLLEDEMLTESGSNAKGRSRRRLSSPSSDSNDALDALYNRQVNKRRDRFESYDSIDDLGDVLMGATHRSLARTNSQPAKKSASDGLQRGRGGSIVAKSKSAESRPQANKSNLSVASMKPSSKTDSLKLGFRTNGTSSSSCKKAITIIKAQKPDLKPPKHEPKEDPLHLEDFSDDSDSDLSYEYESDFYGYGDSEDEDGEGSKHIIDISTDSNTVADTVTPVVSDDESQLQLQQQQTLHAATERLHLYLNNQSGARKSRSNEKSFSTSKTTDNNDVVDQALPMAEQSQRDGLSSSSRVSDKKPRADHVDDNNLTYEKLGRFSQNLTAKIIKTDADRSIEFKKRSGSKQRSISPSKLLANSSLYANHVRKLTYTNEKIDEIAPMRRTKSDEAFAKRGRCGRQSKSRAATTDEQSKCNSLSPTKITSTETTLTTTTEKEKESPNKEPSLNTKSPAIPEKIKRKRGRPKKKKFPSANASVSENQTEKPSTVLPDCENSTVVSVIDNLSSKITNNKLDIQIDTTKSENQKGFDSISCAATEEPVISELLKDNLMDSREPDTKDTMNAESELKSTAAASEQHLCVEYASSIEKLNPTVETNCQILNVKNVVEGVVECHIDTCAVKCVAPETCLKTFEETENTILSTAIGEIADRTVDNSQDKTSSNVIETVQDDVKQSELILEANNENLSEKLEEQQQQSTEAEAEAESMTNQTENNHLIVVATSKKSSNTPHRTTMSAISRKALRSASAMASPLPESQILSSGLESRSGKRLLKDDLALAKKPTQNRNSPCISDKTSEECSDSSANSKELYINNNNDETPQQSTVENKVAEIAKDEIESLSERHLRSSKASTTATLAKNPSRKQPLKTAKDDGKGDVVLTEKKSRRTRQKKNIEKPIEAEVLPEGTIVDKIHIETITALVDEIPLSAEAPQLKADIAKLADVANIEIETLGEKLTTENVSDDTVAKEQKESSEEQMSPTKPVSEESVNPHDILSLGSQNFFLEGDLIRRSTRSRKQTQIALPWRIRSRENKSQEQHKSADETESTPKPKKSERKGTIKKDKSEADQTVYDTPISDSIDQSEIVERSIEKRIPIEDSKNHSSQAVENQVTSDSDDMQLALVPDTHITCSSSGSCRKLRVLLKRVEAKSKTTLCHKFENYVDPPQQELEDITQDTPTEVVTFFHQDQATAANKEPTDSGPSAGKDESSENIDPCETTEKSTDQSPFESQPKQTIVDQEQLSNDENESVIEEQKPVEEDADKDLPQNKTESEEKLQAETEEGAEKNVQKIGVENKEQQPVDETFDEHKDEQPIDAEMKEQQPKPIETEAREQPEQDEKEDIPEKDQQPQETKEYAAGIDQQLLDERVSATKDQPLIETDSKPDQAAGSEQPQTDNFTTQLNPTETTGVVRSVDGVSTVEGCINSVSSEAEANVDASQPDEASKSKLSAKESNSRKSNTMAPPAPPKRELSTGKAVLRRMGKPIQVDVQPLTKRRKLVDTIVFYDDSKDNKETTKEQTINEVPAAKAATSKKQLSATQKVPAMLGRKSDLPKVSTVKCSVSTFLSPERPLAVDNSVIITTTAIANPTVEPFKKVESATVGSGINISVSLVPDAVLPQPKKKLTQAETAKRLISVKAASSKKTEASAAAAAVATLRPVAKSLPAAADMPAEGSKAKPRKSVPATKITGKTAASVLSTQPAKKSLPKKETSKKLITKAEAAATSSSLATRKSVPANLLEAANASAITVKTSNNIIQVIEAAAATSPNKKHEVRKVANKTMGKLKSNETLQSGAAAATVAMTSANPPNATPDSSPSTRDTKRAARIAKPSLATPHVKRGGSHTRSTAGTPTPTQQQESSNEQQQQLAMQQQPKPQRQARRQLKMHPAKEKAQCQAAAAAPASARVLAPTPAPAPIPAPSPTPSPAPAPATSAVQLPEQQPVKHLPSRKRKVPAKFDVDSASVKRLKETPTAKPEAKSIAFPVLITAATVVLPEISSPAAATAAVAVAATATETTKQQCVLPAKHPTTNKLHLEPQLRTPKLRKLHVRLNRNCFKNWLKAHQQQQVVEQPLPTDQAELDSAAEPIPNVPSLIAIQQLLPRLSTIKSVPLPVPLPSLEIKSEQDADEPQPEQMDVDVPLVAARIRTEKAPLISSTMHSLMAAAATTADNCMQPTSVLSNTISTTVNTTITSAITTTDSSNSAIQSASSGAVRDSLTCGTTKMFTYLYPKRSLCSFGHKPLDYCCQNLDGPIPAIDPTRMHEKVEVPVLELPQCMVITTRIISKHDKNIPAKVLAKFEQLTAKDGLPKVLQTVTMTTAIPPTPAAVLAPLAAVTAPQQPTAHNLDRLAKQLTKKQHPPNVGTPALAPTAAPAKALPVNSSQTVTSNLIPRLLQLPPICPSDKQRMELQTRVQHFDAVLQNLSRRAAAMNVSERQLVIEMIVNTSTLLPIDVDVGTKLLENYVYYLNAVTNTSPSPQLRSILTPAPATSTTSSNSKLLQSKSLSRNLTTSAIMRPTSTSSTPEPRRPIYDKQRNIIGYQYRTNQSSPLRTTAGSSGSSSNSSSRSSSLPAGTPIATVAAQQQLQRTRFLMVPNASSKIAVVNSVAQSTVALAPQRVGSSNMIPVYPSRNSKGLPQKAAAIISADKATPVGVVNGVPILGSSASASTATNSPSNRNVFIVNQLLSQPEECILPDAIGGTVVAAEIKDELDDGEILN
ncbi:protein MLP1 homolog isoform X1 [Drosophila grimshawi]|nr:protein MLP1 homolog isoform X1 [Drosophila grimshawi]